MESAEDYYLKKYGPEHVAKRKAAIEKFAESGGLAVTSADHEALGSTPPDLLTKNPGKNLAELMSDKEILEYLKKTEHAIQTLKKEAPEQGPQWEAVRDRGIEKMKIDLRYLEKIGRLPEVFENFNVDAIDPEN